MAIRGPGASGGLLSYVSIKLSFRQWRILANVRRGREGWHNPFGLGGFNAAEVKKLKERSDCTACNRGLATQEGPMHTCCYCVKPQAAAVRSELVASVPDLVHRLASLGYEAVRKPGEDDLRARTAAEYMRQAALSRDWSRDDCLDTLFRLLCVDTWPARTAGTELLALALGDMFDTLTAKPHRVRPLANAWAKWAATWLLRLHAAYKA